MLFARLFRTEIDVALLTQLREPAVIETLAEAQFDIQSILPALDEQQQINLLALDADETQNLTAIRQWQYKFISEHLGKWVARFARQVTLSASSEFYPAFCKLLNEFITTESAALESAVQEPDANL